MPYNGIKADAARQRLAQAIQNAQGSAFGGGSPLGGNYPVTSGFGPRTHPVTGEQSFHTGVDYGAPKGTPVYATATGYVSQQTSAPADPKNPRGNSVTVTAPGQGETRFEHLNNLSSQALGGGWLNEGDLVGFSGDTGRSTGSHLHYGMFDSKGNPINPIQKSPSGKTPVVTTRSWVTDPSETSTKLAGLFAAEPTIITGKKKT